jgi:hypothetical protein
MARKSRFKVAGQFAGSKTTYTLTGTMDSLTAALAAAPYAKAWQESMEVTFPLKKGEARPRPKTITLTIHL